MEAAATTQFGHALIGVAPLKAVQLPAGTEVTLRTTHLHTCESGLYEPSESVSGNVTVTLPPLGSQILGLATLAPATIGQQGAITLTGQNSAGALITATGLRINPTNSFTPLRAFVPSK
jgi:hypothetical protein